VGGAGKGKLRRGSKKKKIRGQWDRSKKNRIKAKRTFGRKERRESRHVGKEKLHANAKTARAERGGQWALIRPSGFLGLRRCGA